MKIMFTTFPGLGHFFPIVPLAWAARSAGHQVLFLTTGPAAGACGQAGLPAVDTSPGIDVLANLRGASDELREKIRRAKREMDLSVDNTMKNPEILHIFAGRMSTVCDKMCDGLVQAARSWQPDVIIHTPLDFAGPLAATLLSVPTVLHGIGPSVLGPQVANSMHPLLDALYQALRPTFDRHGLSGELAKPKAILDICPSSMREANSQAAWPMRYVPYNGGGLLPDWLTEPRASQRRICVTLGTVVPHVMGVGGLSAIIEAVSGLDSEVILTLNQSDLSGTERLPANVRIGGWVPLSELLPSCSVIIHHGGSGTTMNALVAGVPQLVIPQMADQHMNADAVQKRGVGITHLPEEADAKTVNNSLKQLVEDPGFSKNADEVRRENLTLSTPPEILARILDTVSQFK